MMSRVVYKRQDHTAGATSPPSKTGFRGIMGRAAPYSKPATSEVVRWIVVARSSAFTLKAVSCAIGALAALGEKPATSRLMGYQMLPQLIHPYSIANRAIATLPASPPLMP